MKKDKYIISALAVAKAIAGCLPKTILQWNGCRTPRKELKLMLR